MKVYGLVYGPKLGLTYGPKLGLTKNFKYIIYGLGPDSWSERNFEDLFKLENWIQNYWDVQANENSKSQH